MSASETLRHALPQGVAAGRYDPRFSEVVEAFLENFAEHDEVGASVCVVHEGETVVDLWGGWADAAQTQRWERDTIANVYSTTKTMVALTALLLADRGELDWDAPVARYWPEFAAEGKSVVKVRHLMSHTAGLPHLPKGIALEDISTALRVYNLARERGLGEEVELWPG